MSYDGVIAPVPLGKRGLVSDLNPKDMPPDALLSADNVVLRHGLIEKEGGSRRWNASALDSAVVGFYDWFPESHLQRPIALTRNGTLYRFENVQTSTTLTVESGSPSTLNLQNVIPVFVEGGQESIGNPKKLFLFTGTNQIQVIQGTNTTRRSISLPASDWDSSPFPTFGIIHRSRLWTFLDHRVYASETGNQEDFQGAGVYTSPVYPGEGEKLVTAFIYKGRLFFVKYPKGLYVLDDSDASSANWVIRRVSGAAGAPSPTAAVEIANDVLIANSIGSLTSVQAAEAFGDVSTADMITSLGVERFFSESLQPDGRGVRHTLYYEGKKKVFVTYRGAGYASINRILTLTASPDSPVVTINTKDSPNFLSEMIDVTGVSRPVYGSDDGYVYLMDQEDRELNGSGYRGEFRTAHWDFSWLGAEMVDSLKNFDFLEVNYEPTGKWNLSVDVYVDERFVRTLSFDLSKGVALDQGWKLDTHELAGRGLFSKRLPISAQGRRISYRAYNSGLRQNFRISGLTTYFRPAGQGQKGD